MQTKYKKPSDAPIVHFRVPHTPEGLQWIAQGRKYLNRDRYGEFSTRPRGGSRGRWDFSCQRHDCKFLGVYLREREEIRQERWWARSEIYAEWDRERKELHVKIDRAEALADHWREVFHKEQEHRGTWAKQASRQLEATRTELAEIQFRHRRERRLTTILGVAVVALAIALAMAI